MSKYLSLFEQDNEYRESSKTLPNVSNVIEDEAVYYQDDYSGEYLTFKILSDGEIGWNNTDSQLNTPISYSINNGDWIQITETSSFSVSFGDVVRFKGENEKYNRTYNYTTGNRFSSTCKYNLCGNIKSLIFGDNFAASSVITASWTFADLFYNNVNLISAKDLYLGNELAYGCFYRMFSGCSNLKSAPELPSTILKGGMLYIFIWKLY